MALIFHIYKRTVDRNVWGRQYLNEHFFTMLAQRFRHRLCLVLAVRNGDVVGATFNVLKDGVLYGRYWGSLQERERASPTPSPSALRTATGLSAGHPTRCARAAALAPLRSRRCAAAPSISR
eukprot:6857726-Prymnesium_polylepis.1